jgi:hypothetical protein
MALLLCAGGCSFGRMGLGSAKGGYVLDAEGKDQDAARDNAVASFFGAFISSAPASDVLQKKFIPASRSYVKREKILDKRGDAVRLRVLVDYPKLARDLEEAGLVRPEGVVGRPRAALWIEELGVGADKELGRASEAVRHALSERGYDAFTLADPLGGNKPKSESSALERARKQGASVLVSGTAQAALTEDERLADFHPVNASIGLKIITLPKGEAVEDVALSASAVDLQAEGAGAKALMNAGEMAADRVMTWLANQYKERREMSVVIAGLGGLEQAKKLLAALRAQDGIAGAALVQVQGRDVKLRVFVERQSADELAANLLKIPGYSFTVRSVETGFDYVELDTEGEVPF